ncbi:hypothetical protein M0813_16010 [Anaeramoeba flamelloides]|uniref:EF-hand domain-containing protein n=1 Tax=Anaeramoeba flamelloides TaxID=1746091 RepID=A0ABQ8Z143_9EUKA|nr:hypothetical protein M0813_16010 [Anaeramoeba flamelloides]
MTFDPQTAIDFFNKVKGLYDTFVEVKEACEKLTVRLALIMECLNILSSNEIVEKQAQNAFQKVLDQLGDLIHEIEDFINGVIGKTGKKPKKGRNKKARFKKKLVEWGKKVKNFLLSEENQEQLGKFEAQLGDIVSAINLAISVQMSIDVKRTFELTKKNQELIQEAGDSIKRVESRLDSMDEGIQLLVTAQKEKEKEKKASLQRACSNKTPETFTETLLLPLKGGEILFNLIGQRVCTREQGLKPRLVSKFMNLNNKELDLKAYFCANYFFKSWDLDGSGTLDKDEVTKNINDLAYLASLFDYKNQRLFSYVESLESATDKNSVEEARKDLEYRYIEELEDFKVINKMFQNKTEITQEEFSEFMKEKEQRNGVLGELFYVVININDQRKEKK